MHFRDIDPLVDTRGNTSTTMSRPYNSNKIYHFLSEKRGEIKEEKLTARQNLNYESKLTRSTSIRFFKTNFK